METIRNYLESMFAALPNTPEVIRAKQELGAMMEDKYSELIAEGRSENEAVGIVISEFGNLEELSEDLGIGGILREQPGDSRPFLGLAEAREYLNTKDRASLYTGIGVLLCIISPVGFVIGGFLYSRSWTAVGLGMLFACIAAAVGLFIYSGLSLGKWKKVEKRRVRLDLGTAEAVKNDWDRVRPGYALMIIIGVICIILSVVPICIIGFMYKAEALHGAFGTSLIFILTGIGVLLLVSASGRKAGYQNLLRLNNAGTRGGRYAGSDMSADESKIYYENQTVGKLMSVYWPAITAAYLIISFLTWNWWITWIIWPIAGIAATIINKLFGTPVQEA